MSDATPLVALAKRLLAEIVCNDRSGPQDTSPRPDPRQNEEGVTQADLKAASEYAQFRVDNEHELAKAFAAHRRAAIASMDPVRQVAMELREALEAFLADYDDDRRDLQLEADHVARFRSALASADAVLGEGE